MNEFLKRARELMETMRTDRRYLHQNAEVGNELPASTRYVMDRLREIGLQPEEICQCGVTALIRGKKPGKTYLLRAEMDALPMCENNDLPYHSRTSGAHNCGHDLHTAMLLAAATMLKEREEELEGCVKLMFQPAEETFTGSEAMIRAGVLENPRVDAASAIHTMLDWDAPSYAYGVGNMTSSCDGFQITVTGSGCHGAMPHLGIDPINVGLHIYSAYQELIARETPPAETASLTFGQFTAGNTSNIIPETALMQGTLRTYNPELRQKLVRRMKEIAQAAEIMFDAKVEYKVLSAVPSTITDPGTAAELAGYLEDLGAGLLKDTHYRVLPSDDFAFISQHVPTVYFQLGTHMAGNPYPHHNPGVLFDENAMPLGAAIHAQCAFQWLKNNH